MLRPQLDELLRQNTSLAPSTTAATMSAPPPKGKLAQTAHIFNGRVLKNLSLFLVSLVVSISLMGY